MEWFSNWFDTPYYHLLYKNRDDIEAQLFIVELIKILEIKKEEKIFDLACGKGRHSIFLNSLGYEVIGMDLSEKSIIEAKKLENDRLSFYQGDMRNTYFPNQFHVILNLFTSLGYFEDVKDNEKVFRAISNQLLDNGKFVLDYFNSQYIINTIIKEETKKVDETTFTITKKVENNFIVKNIQFIDRNKEFNFQEKVQLFHYYDFIDLGKQVSLEFNSIYGNYKLEDFNEEISPRCIIVFTKNGK